MTTLAKSCIHPGAHEKPTGAKRDAAAPVLVRQPAATAIARMSGSPESESTSELAKKTATKR